MSRGGLREVSGPAWEPSGMALVLLVDSSSLPPPSREAGLRAAAPAMDQEAGPQQKAAMLTT